MQTSQYEAGDIGMDTRYIGMNAIHIYLVLCTFQRIMGHIVSVTETVGSTDEV